MAKRAFTIYYDDKKECVDYVTFSKAFEKEDIMFQSEILVDAIDALDEIFEQKQKELMLALNYRGEA